MQNSEDFHENPPPPHILPSLTVTKSVYPPPPPLRDVINGCDVINGRN